MDVGRGGSEGRDEVSGHWADKLLCKMFLEGREAWRLWSAFLMEGEKLGIRPSHGSMVLSVIAQPYGYPKSALQRLAKMKSIEIEKS